jgi:hypothetical protein
MLRITWDANAEIVFKVSGRLDAESVGDLKALFSSEANGRWISRDEPPPARASLARVLSFLRTHLTLYMMSVINIIHDGHHINDRQELTTSIVELYRALGGGWNQ